MRTVPRPVAPPAVDAATKQIIHGLAIVDRATGTIQIRIPMKLEGTNAGMWGSHWSRKRKATEEWETRLKTVMADFCGRDTVSGFHPFYIRALGLEPVECLKVGVAGVGGRQTLPGRSKHRCSPDDPACRLTRRVVQVRRLCPSRRNFTRDDDHTPMAQKPLLDAVKRLGLIRDDARTWTALRPLQQDVSPDGRWWTEIEITVGTDADFQKASPNV